MARMPEANWQGEHGSRSMSTPEIVCIHTIVGNAPAHAAHFSTHGDGRIDQSRDTRLCSAANLDGNGRVIAIENEDHGPQFRPWNINDGHAVPALTDAQVEACARILAWSHKEHGIPLQLCPNSRPGSKGLAYHRQGIDGNFGDYRYGGRVPGGETWTEHFGKVCVVMDITEVLTERGWVALAEVQHDEAVASWSPETGAVTFAPAVRIEPFAAETVRVGAFECTPDHEWVVADQSAVVVCSCGYTGTPRGVRNHAGHGTRRGEQHRVIREAGWKTIPATEVPTRATLPVVSASSLEGLPLSDDQIRLAVWLQADGHIMREGAKPIGVEWHLSKPRKIARLLDLLDRLGVVRSRSWKADGSTSIRVWGAEARAKVLALLPDDKRFGPEWLGMSRSQVDALWDEAVQADGASTIEKPIIFSTDKQSLDTIQAASLLAGVDCTMWRSGGLWWLLRRRRPRGLTAPVRSRVTEVGCLTTVDGTLIIRQNGAVAITGNCPGDRRIAQLPEILRQARVLVGVEEDTVDEKDVKKIVDAVKPLFKEAVGDIVTAIERSQPKTAEQTWGTEVDPTAELPWQRTAEGRVRATGNIVARTEDKVGVLREGQKQAVQTIEGRLDRIVGLLEQRLGVTEEAPDEPEGAAQPELVGDVEESGTDRPSG